MCKNGGDPWCAIVASRVKRQVEVSPHLEHRSSSHQQLLPQNSYGKSTNGEYVCSEGTLTLGLPCQERRKTPNKRMMSNRVTVNIDRKATPMLRIKYGIELVKVTFFGVTER